MIIDIWCSFWYAGCCAPLMCIFLDCLWNISEWRSYSVNSIKFNIHLNFKFSKKAILLRRNPRRTGTGLAGDAMGMANGCPSECREGSLSVLENVKIKVNHISTATYVSRDDKSDDIVDSSATSAMETACCSICLRDCGVEGFSGVSGGGVISLA